MRVKQQKGITLIALIITVLILMVLAGIAISSIEDNKIIGYTNNVAVNLSDKQNKLEDNRKEHEDFLNDDMSDGGTTDNPTDIPNDDDSDDDTEYVPQGREGQTVKYDSNKDGIKEDWIILTDRDGLLEIVSEEATGKLKLGSGDTEIINNKDKYLDINGDGAADDLDGDGTIGNDADIAIASYNNAITTINNYCKSLVTATDNEGVRSVGASSDTSGYYSSTNFNSWFKNSETVKVKAGDEYYKTDYEKMQELGIASTPMKRHYWLASRLAYGDSYRVYFIVRYVGASTIVNTSDDLWGLTSNDAPYSSSCIEYVRPVVINPKGI